MKIHVLSDIHLEFGDFQPPETDADVVVLAGDIGPGLDGIEWAERTFNKPVVYVLGNHEFYCRRSMNDLIESARERCQRSGRIYLLEDNELVIGEVRFLGATLWTDFALFGANEDEFSMNYALLNMTDFHQILTDLSGDRTAPVSPRLLLARHHITRDFLERSLGQSARPGRPKTVVVTHHAPSARSLKAGKPRDRLEAAYASHLDHMPARADLWVHGHTHVEADYFVPEVGRFSGMGRRVVCNPRGYADQGPDAVANFNPGLVIEV